MRPLLLLIPLLLATGCAGVDSFIEEHVITQDVRGAPTPTPEAQDDSVAAFMERHSSVYGSADGTAGPDQRPTSGNAYILEDGPPPERAQTGSAGSGAALIRTAAQTDDPPAAPQLGERAPLLLGTEEPVQETGNQAGYIDMDGVEAAMDPQIGRISAYCLDVASFQNEALTAAVGGVMVLNLTVTERGRIARAALSPSSTIRDERFRSCLEEQLRRLQLPGARGGAARFDYPVRVGR